MKRVFISHSSRDFESFVRPLAEVLEREGIRTWYSERDLRPGSSWAASIAEAIPTADYVLAVVSDAVLLSPGQIKNELRLATQCNKRILTIKNTDKPIPSELTYFLGLNAIAWRQKTQSEAYRVLLECMGVQSAPERASREQTDRVHGALQWMAKHTDPIFSETEEMGGYSWGLNKSVVQNLNGGWPLNKVRIERWNDIPFSMEQQPWEGLYRAYLDTPAAEAIRLKGKNHRRWMLTGFDTAYDSLFLSVQRTQWLDTQFVWHQLLSEEAERKKAIEAFFDTECSNLPTSLCLHLVLIDSEGAAVATRISRRKRDDYPSTIAVTLGEQLDETDYTAADRFLVQWLKRALVEEFGFTPVDYAQYVDEGSARILSLTMEGDIYNFALTCCVRLKCTAEQLAEYYRLHRSFGDEFNEVFPIPMEEIPELLENSLEQGAHYHPSSFLRLLYAYLYVRGELPSLKDR